MAKKKDAKKEKRPSRAEAVRAAVDQAFQTTAQATADAGQLTRGRATEIADELVGNISRLRDALDDARPATAEDIKALKTELAALGDRVARLENTTAGTAAGAAPGATRRGGAKAAPGTPSSRASASRTAAAKRTSAAAAAAKPASGSGSGQAKGSPAPGRRAAASKKPASGS